jgi:hypothetical protein
MAVTVVAVGTGSANRPSDGQLNVSQFPTSIHHHILLDNDGEFTNLTVNKTTSTLIWNGVVYVGDLGGIFELKSQINPPPPNRYLFDITTYSTNPNIVQVAGQFVTWSMQLRNSTGTLLWGSPEYTYTVYTTAPDKATNPDPTDDAVNKQNFSDLKLEWTNGARTVSVEVWMGTGGSLTKLAEGVTDEFYVVDLASVPKEAVVQWQIVSVNTAGSTDGDVWEFDPRPDKPTDPEPANGADPVGLNHTISLSSGFEHGANPGTSYKFYEGLAPGSLTLNLEFEDPFIVFWHLKLYSTPYYWRLDAVNEFGTTEGTEWSFMTLVFVPPYGFGGVDGSGGGPGGGISGGVGDGGFATNKILVAVATNSVPGSSKVYYET